MRLGLDVAQQRMSWDENASRVKFADQLGFDGVWGFDHFQPMYGDGPGECFEGMTTLAAWSGITERVRLGLARGRHDVSAPVGVRVRSDHDRSRVARATRALVRRGVVRQGAQRARHPVPRPEEPGRRVRGSGADRARACSPPTTSRSRASTSVPRTPRCIPRPVQTPHPPIWIGASGEKRMMPIAARYADVWHCFGPPEYLEQKSQRLTRVRGEGGPRSVGDHARRRRCRSTTSTTRCKLDRRVGEARLRLPRVRLARRGPGPSRGVREGRARALNRRLRSPARR